MASPIALRDELDRLRPDLAVEPQAGEVLAASFQTASAAWPALALPATTWVKHLAARLPPGPATDLTAAIGALSLADIYLAAAIEEGVAGALEAFDTLARPVFAEAARAVRGSSAVEGELRSRVMVRVLGPRGEGPEAPAPAINEFGGRCTLRGWLRVIAVREGIKLVNAEKRGAATGDDALYGALAPDLGADVLYMKELYRGKVRDAFAAALAGLSAKQRLLFRQHVIDELTLDQMAPLHSVGRSTVSRWLIAAREALAKATRKEIAVRLEIPASEVDSILRLVQSQLDITLGPLRAASAAK